MLRDIQDTNSGKRPRVKIARSNVMGGGATLDAAIESEILTQKIHNEITEIQRTIEESAGSNEARDMPLTFQQFQ